MSCDSFRVMKDSFKVPMPPMSLTLFLLRSSTYRSHAYQHIPSELSTSPLTFTAPVLTRKAKRPPTPCTTLLVLPTTDVVSASFTCVHKYVA